MFDELSTYLDVRQRMVAAEVIRDLRSDYIIVVEHDLAVLDYLSDFVCCLWGVAGAYGVVTMPYTTREGVNIFLDGYVPTENLRFRKNPLVFNAREEVDDSYERSFSVEYPEMKKSLGSSFVLQVEKGSFSNSEVIVLLGQNGSGKTTFLRMLAGLLEPDNGFTIPALNVSYKPQTFARKFGGTVHELLLMKIRDAYFDPQFQSDVMKPMLIANIEAQLVQTLSGGEVQRVALVLALGKSADMYLIDEPSAFLDIEQRVVASQVIKRFVLHTKKTAFIVEHDFMMSTYLADRVILFDGKPGGYGTASSPTSLLEGMNKFLSQLKVTFRRDPTNFRPRINKLNSIKDREQKMSGKYFTIDD
jgi:ATP-binding cassette subfamily E protein 1